MDHDEGVDAFRHPAGNHQARPRHSGAGRPSGLLPYRQRGLRPARHPPLSVRAAVPCADRPRLARDGARPDPERRVLTRPRRSGCGAGSGGPRRPSGAGGHDDGVGRCPGRLPPSHPGGPRGGRAAIRRSPEPLPRGDEPAPRHAPGDVALCRNVGKSGDAPGGGSIRRRDLRDGQSRGGLAPGDPATARAERRGPAAPREDRRPPEDRPHDPSAGELRRRDVGEPPGPSPVRRGAGGRGAHLPDASEPRGGEHDAGVPHRAPADPRHRPPSLRTVHPDPLAGMADRLRLGRGSGGGPDPREAPARLAEEHGATRGRGFGRGPSRGRPSRAAGGDARGGPGGHRVGGSRS